MKHWKMIDLEFPDLGGGSDLGAKDLGPRVPSPSEDSQKLNLSKIQEFSACSNGVILTCFIALGPSGILGRSRALHVQSWN